MVVPAAPVTAPGHVLARVLVLAREVAQVAVRVRAAARVLHHALVLVAGVVVGRVQVTAQEVAQADVRGHNRGDYHGSLIKRCKRPTGQH